MRVDCRTVAPEELNARYGVAFLVPDTVPTAWAVTGSVGLAQWYPRVAVYDDVVAGTLSRTSAGRSSISTMAITTVGNRALVT